MLTRIPSTFQPLTEEDRLEYGEPQLVSLSPPPASNETCRRKVANWLAWRAAPYPADRHSEYLYDPSRDGEEGPGILVSAVMSSPSSMDDYVRQVARNRRYDVRGRKAVNRGYEARPIRPADHARGIWEVIHSTHERQGRPIAPQFLDRPPDHDFADFAPVDDAAFDDLCTGVFTPGGSLAAYFLGKRVGEHVVYEEIMGHGDHVQYDVMYLLHFTFLEQCVASPAPPACLNYGSWYSGSNPFSPDGGLNRWKRKVTFKPAYLILASS